MKKFGSKLKQAGISLLEVLLSLAIISIILVMAMQYFTTAGNNQKLNMVRTFIGADMAAVQGYGINNSGDFSLLTWDSLVSGGYLSSDTKNISCTGNNTGCSQNTPWGDPVGDLSTTSPVTMTIPLPSEALCQNLVQSYGDQFVTCETTTGKATVYLSGPATT